MRRLDVSDQILKASTWSSRHFIFDHRGDVVAFWGPTFIQEQRQRRLELQSQAQEGEQHVTHDTPSSADWKRVARHNLHIPRQALRRVLFDSLAPGTVRWGHELLGINMVNGGCRVQLDFGDGRAFTADAVVAADGIFSAVRKLIARSALSHNNMTATHAAIPTKEEAADKGCAKLSKTDVRLSGLTRLSYLGLVVVLGVFEGRPHRLCHQRAIQMSDGATRIFMMPFSKTEAMWQLTFRVTDEAEAKSYAGQTRQLKDLALQLCGDWAAPIPDILRSTSLDMMSG